MMHSNLLRCLASVYQLLLYAYPAEFRRKFGAGMTQVFTTRCAAVARVHGIRGVMQVAFETVIDWLVTAARENLVALRAPTPLPASAQPSSDRVPSFYSCRDDTPRPSALINGMAVAIAFFALILFSINHGRTPAFLSQFGFAPAADIDPSSSGGISGPISGSGDTAVVTIGGPSNNSSPNNAESAVTPSMWTRIKLIFKRSKREPALAGSLGSTNRTNLTPLPVSVGDKVFRDLMSQFNRYDLVGLAVEQNTREDQELVHNLIHQSNFPGQIHNIVIDCANSRYQDLVDRYVAGDNLPDKELQRIWRDTTDSAIGAGWEQDPACKQLLSDVRSLNETLPETLRVRVLAAGAPIDWTKITTKAALEVVLAERNSDAIKIVEHEVLANHEKALLVSRSRDLWRNTGTPNFASLWDARHPARLFTVVRLGGGRYTGYLDNVIWSAKRPAVIPLNGNAFGTLRANNFLARDELENPFSDNVVLAAVADACVYTGPATDTVIASERARKLRPAESAELARRMRLAMQ